MSLLAPFFLSLLFCDDAEEDVGAFFDFNGELVLLGAGLLLLDRLRVVIGMASDGGQCSSCGTLFLRLLSWLV